MSTVRRALVVSTALVLCGTSVGANDVGSYAGKYLRGFPLGFEWTMDVDAAGIFHYTWTGCLGLYDENRGHLVAESDRLLVEMERPLPKDSPFSIPKVWLPVRWGDRLYLLAEDELLKLVNEINRGSEPRRSWSGFLLLRAEDWHKDVTGPPELPPSFLRMLLRQPVTGRVLSATPQRAQLGLGSRDGLFVGMDLYARSSSNDPCVLTVTDVWPGQSMTSVWCIIGRVRAGAAVSSRERE